MEVEPTYRYEKLTTLREFIEDNNSISIRLINALMAYINVSENDEYMENVVPSKLLIIKGVGNKTVLEFKELLGKKNYNQ